MSPFDKDVPLSADAVDRVREEVVARTIGRGRLGMPQQRGGGTLLFKRPSYFEPVVRRVPAGIRPFAMSITPSGATRTITFRAGTINAMLPSNYLTGVTVPQSGTRYIVLDVTVSSGVVTAAALAADSSAPPAITPMAGEPPTSFKILIGLCIDAVLFQIWLGNIQALPVPAFSLQKVTPVAGQVPYDVYYTWELGVL